MSLNRIKCFPFCLALALLLSIYLSLCLCTSSFSLSNFSMSCLSYCFWYLHLSALLFAHSTKLFDTQRTHTRKLIHSSHPHTHTHSHTHTHTFISGINSAKWQSKKHQQPEQQQNESNVSSLWCMSPSHDPKEKPTPDLWKSTVYFWEFRVMIPSDLDDPPKNKLNRFCTNNKVSLGHFNYKLNLITKPLWRGIILHTFTLKKNILIRQ